MSGGIGARSDGTKVQLWGYGGGSNQEWEAVPAGNGYYNLIARNSGKCLDLPGGSTSNGVQSQI